jgi:ubiquinone/menaquinone biosynthesis C-methylase UbiE
MPENLAADDEQGVSALYKDTDVAESYIDRRFVLSWNRLLHDRQVRAVNEGIKKVQPKALLEVAPGPARIATDLTGVTSGVMVEYSEQMIEVGQGRLREAGLDSVWDLRHGNAFELKEFYGQFDMIFTFRFIRHFATEDRVRIYKELHSCLRPGGVVMFDVVNQHIRDKLDSKTPAKPEGELDVFDVTYQREDFASEMDANGFELLRLEPVLNHFDLQSSISYRLDHRMKFISEPLVRLLEKIPSQHPLEWNATCRKL